MLTVYKASAGSGKTFQLVAEYLVLLLKRPLNYKQILAVTFTNKATAEMKNRILEQLDLLAKNKNSDYLPLLESKTQYSEDLIRKKAQQVLKNILHDYNRFSVSTIDSFTQRVIKAFNRELGISPNFSIELDSSLILEEAVDRLLAKIDSDKKLRKWLIQFSQEKINENKNHKIEEDIKQLGRELFNERFQMFFPEDSNIVFSKERLKEFKSELDKIVHTFEKLLQTKGKTAVTKINEQNLSINDFLYKAGGVAGYLKKIAEGEIKVPGTRVLNASEDFSKWVHKKHPKKTEIDALVKNSLNPILLDILSFLEKHKMEYYSAKVVLSQLRILGILTDLKEEIKLLLNEKSLLQISDSNLLLSKIIGNSDSPFVYEKIGNSYKHFLLDEFQDTSTLQWNNFKPLISNSLSEGNNNLVVGDAKQSIYRWRNGDWNILANKVNTDFPEFSTDIKNLKVNWRSEKNIIAFNNEIIEELKNAFINELFPGEDSDMWQVMQEKFEAIFSDVKQKQGNKKTKTKGWVNIQFFDKDTYADKSTELIIEQVKSLQDKGVQANEIAILIRKNNEGTKIIETFLEASRKEENKNYNLTVLSNESLFLCSSSAVLFVINLIEILINSKNKIAKAAAWQIWNTELKPNFKENNKPGKTNPWQFNAGFETDFDNELGKHLIKINEKLILSSIDESISEICSTFHLFSLADEIPFLQTLIDYAGEIKSSISNDLSNLLHWWNEKGYKTSVSVNEEINAIRLLTIHKSKGLEFEAVILPKFDWSTEWSQSPTLWCSSEKEPFNKLLLFPVKATKIVENSYFRNEYIKEKSSNYIDNLNLIYVAFTRAKSALLIHAPDSEKPGKKINSLLKLAIENMATDQTFSNCWNEESKVFNFGELHFTIENKIEEPVKALDKYHYTDFKSKINLRYSSDDFLSADSTGKTSKNKGKIIHEILSMVTNEDQISKACKSALSNGKINEKECIQLQEFIPTQIKHLKLENWFNGSMKILNERNVITPEGLLRPDRMMVDNNTVIVVDYKTGEQKSEKHIEQVMQYAHHLKSVGYKKVTGFLWYIILGEVEKVCEL